MSDKLSSRVSSIISDFLIKNVTSRNETNENIITEFGINRPIDDGVQVPNPDLAIENANTVISKQIPLHNSNLDCNNHLAIKKLGKPKEKKNGANQKTVQNRSEQFAAEVIASYHNSVTIAVVNNSIGTNGVESKLIISDNADGAEPMTSMLRSSYGMVETEAVSHIPTFKNNYCALGKKIFRSKNEKKKDKTFENYISWSSAVLSALPADNNFVAEVRFQPIEKKKDIAEIDRKLIDLYDAYDELKFSSDIAWNNTLSLGANISTRAGVLDKENIVGGTNSGDSINNSFTLGSKEVSKEANLTLERLEQEILRLDYAKSHGAWAVYITVSADNDNTLWTITTVIAAALRDAGIDIDQWNDVRESGRTPILLTYDEILPLLKLPDKEFPGFEFIENEEFALVSPENISDGFKIGNIMNNGNPFAPFVLSPNAFSRHAFICGMTGSGKTTTMFNIIEGINLPFMVIEPVKGEYRALSAVYPDFKVFTAKITASGDRNTDVLRINPFWFPNNSNIAFHIDSIKTIIASAFDLEAAMPNILEQCIYNIYTKSGWDLVTNKNRYSNSLPEEYLYPTFSDLCTEIEDYLNKSDFDSEVMGNYKGALLTRLKSFVSGYKGILLNTTAYPDYGSMMNGHCVIELEALADDADKCLVMGTILVQYYQYLKMNFSDNSNSNSRSVINHLIVIEEAHRLFKNIKNSRDNKSSNPTGQLVDSLSNMMAEIRAFGEGMLIVDQSPTKIAEDVVKNSATKIIHRIDNGDDIKVLQSSMLLPDDILSFASLGQGEALVRTDHMNKPVKVKMDLTEEKKQYSLSSAFQNEAFDNTELSKTFIATSILADEDICEKIQEKLLAFISTLVLSGMENWYGLVYDLLNEIILILKAHKVYDAVDYRMSVVMEIISLSLKRLGLGENKNDIGHLHLFVMRLMDFFCDERKDIRMKDDAKSLFSLYLTSYISGIVKSLCLKNVPNSTYIQLKSDSCEDTVIMCCAAKYVNDIQPILEQNANEYSPENIFKAFVSNEILFTGRTDVYEKYRDEFILLLKRTEYFAS